MVETLTAWSPLYVPPRRTAFVSVRATGGGRYSASYDGHLVASETTRPFRDAAAMLLAEFGFQPGDRIVIRLTGGATGDREALVSTVGKIAQQA